MTWVRRLFPALATCSGLAVAGVHVHADSITKYTNPVERSMYFWVNAFPIYCQYKFVEWWFDGTPWEEQEPYFNWLHNRHASSVENVCLKLKGFYLKGAQVASTRDELLPEQYLHFCKKFQDEVPSELKDREVLEATICESYGIRTIEEVFDFIEEEPIGAASIGVVHKAKLKDGRIVAVKVQFPDIEERFRNDIKTVKNFCAMALPSHLPFLNELERQFLTEFDYVAEAENLNEIREAILPTWKRYVNIPYGIKEFCTKNVMVMEYLDGSNLLRSIVKQYESLAAKKGITLAELAEGESKRKAHSAAFQALRISIVRQLMFTADLVYNIPTLLYNVTLGIVRGRMPYMWSEYPLNLAKILDTLVSIHGYQIFQNGVFNADPHPGNILLLKDGRIGLIDYGQVKRISLEKRLKYAKLVLYLARDDKHMTVMHATTNMGLRTKNMNEEIMYRLLAFFHDRDTDDVTGGRNVQKFMDWTNKEDPILNLDEDYVMCGRVALLLRGLGNAFHIKLRICKYWKENAKLLLKTQPNLAIV